MIPGVMLQYASYYGGGTFGDILNSFAQNGVFAYLLPFLVIFAIVYATIGNLKVLGDNKAINAIISVSVAFMSLQFDFVPIFFSEVFPRLGVGLGVILVILIAVGLFWEKGDEKLRWIRNALLTIAFIVAAMVLLNTYDSIQGFFSFGSWGSGDMIERVLAIALIVGAIAWVMNDGKSDSSGGDSGKGKNKKKDS